jgi:hypothetical protein
MSADNQGAAIKGNRVIKKGSKGGSLGVLKASQNPDNASTHDGGFIATGKRHA